MYKIFRKLRQQFLMEQKTFAYVKYAIGEIILVMIGILLALQISNWNDDEKDKHLEQTFLEKLKSNLEDDIALYKDVNTSNTNFLKHLDSAQNILEHYKNFTTKDLQKHLPFLMYHSRFNTNQTAFDNLVSIGKMNIIQNDALTENLLLYYRRVNLLKESMAESIDAYNRNSFGPTLLKFDYSNPNANFNQKAIKAYAEDPIITNSLGLKIVMFNKLIADYETQILEAEDLIKLINTELKND